MFVLHYYALINSEEIKLLIHNGRHRDQDNGTGAKTQIFN